MATREPAKPALVAVGPAGENARRFTFSDLSRASNRAANFLGAHGVRKGDRVLVMLPRIPEWYDVMLGCMKLGAVPMPGTTQLTGRDIEYRVNQAEASVAITDADGVAKVDEVRDRCPTLSTFMSIGGTADKWLSFEDGLAAASESAPDAEPTASDDPLLIYFTSGTVAYPKMVLHTQASLGIGHEIAPRGFGRTSSQTTCTGLCRTSVGRRRLGANCSGSGGSVRSCSCGTREASRIST